MAGLPGSQKISGCNNEVTVLQRRLQGWVPLSLPADVLWGLFLFVTHKFLPVGRNECVTNKNKPHRTTAGRLGSTVQFIFFAVGHAI